MKNMKVRTQISNIFFESSEIIKNSSSLIKEIEKTINEITECYKKHNKVLIFGNGGSAADAQHIAAELIGRFKKERKSLPAIALTTDTSVISSLANDYSFEKIFSRQCESLVTKGDIVIGISTSGNSKNVQAGLITAKKMGAKTIGLLGNKGGKIKNYVDIPIIVNSSSTPRIQEVHRIIYHIICEMIEKNIVSKVRK
jgi:D-sedoheptulose 7-phosphate isomerase